MEGAPRAHESSPDRARKTPSQPYLAVLGAPGSGKSTQARILSEQLQIPRLSTGDRLRAEVAGRSELGRRVEETIARGELVPDEVIVAAVRHWLRAPDLEGGFVLDGFPRTLGQAVALDREMENLNRSLDLVLHLRVPTDEVLRRLAVRRAEHQTPGEGSASGRRVDDLPEVARRRIEAYLQDSAPLLDHYRARGILAEIDGAGPVEETSERMMAAVAGATGGPRTPPPCC